jgi:hypothetical protein
VWFMRSTSGYTCIWYIGQLPRPHKLVSLRFQRTYEGPSAAGHGGSGGLAPQGEDHTKASHTGVIQVIIFYRRQSTKHIIEFHSRNALATSSLLVRDSWFQLSQMSLSVLPITVKKFIIIDVAGGTSQASPK